MLYQNLFLLSVLQRSEDDGIGFEELDTLQSEIETLLASVAKRMRLLEGEEGNLANVQEKSKTANKVLKRQSVI